MRVGGESAGAGVGGDWAPSVGARVRLHSLLRTPDICWRVPSPDFLEVEGRGGMAEPDSEGLRSRTAMPSLCDCFGRAETAREDVHKADGPNSDSLPGQMSIRSPSAAEGHKDAAGEMGEMRDAARQQREERADEPESVEKARGRVGVQDAAKRQKDKDGAGREWGPQGAGAFADAGAGVSDDWAPSVGARVRLHSLLRTPEHNGGDYGAEGEVVEFDASAGRWRVGWRVPTGASWRLRPATSRCSRPRRRCRPRWGR